MNLPECSEVLLISDGPLAAATFKNLPPNCLCVAANFEEAQQMLGPTSLVVIDLFGTRPHSKREQCRIIEEIDNLKRIAMNNGELFRGLVILTYDITDFFPGDEKKVLEMMPFVHGYIPSQRLEKDVEELLHTLGKAPILLEENGSAQECARHAILLMNYHYLQNYFKYYLNVGQVTVAFNSEKGIRIIDGQKRDYRAEDWSIFLYEREAVEEMGYRKKNLPDTRVTFDPKSTSQQYSVASN